MKYLGEFVNKYTKRDINLAYELTRDLPSGVSYRAEQGRRKHWLARLEINGKRVLNKRFSTKEEAIAARLAAEKGYF